MSNIIAAHFDSVDQANRALEALQAGGFTRSQMASFHVNAPGQHQLLPTGGDNWVDPNSKGAGEGAIKGAAIGATAAGIIGGIAAAVLVPGAGLVALAAIGSAGAGAYAGSLAGALNGMPDENDREAPQVIPRAAGLMLAVRIDRPEAFEPARRILQAHGGEDIEEAEGVLREGKWVDFDPGEPPRPAA